MIWKQILNAAVLPKMHLCWKTVLGWFQAGIFKDFNSSYPSALLQIIHAACRRVVIHLTSAIQNWGFKPKLAVMVPLYFRRRLAPAAPVSPITTSVKVLCCQMTPAFRGRHTCPVPAIPPHVFRVICYVFLCYLPYQHSVYTICLKTFWPRHELLFPSVSNDLAVLCFDLLYYNFCSTGL